MIKKSNFSTFKGFIPTLMVARLAIGAEEKSTECFSEGPRCIEDRPSCDMEAGP